MNTGEFHSVTDVCARIGWPLPQVVDRTGSTNDDLVGVPGHGLVLIAREQTAGKGRLARDWISRPGDGLTFSVRLEVPATVSAWGWIPLLAGVAVVDAIRAAGAAGVAVKWPNDVVAPAGKLAGILTVGDGNSAIVGIGINLRFGGPAPDPAAASVVQAGGNPDGDALLAAVVGGLHGWWTRFAESGGDAHRCGLHDAYSGQCVTLDRDVEVFAPDRTWSGHAAGIDRDGRLLVRVADGSVAAVSAADVSLSR
ncbi:MAG TPA: biotin--[acetyl-CoA-carboxylase] ligase [Actinomycetota bacterium]|nr:biotin--[acetyl-CoA-carboxylase] ligase [Actinomycetota bacterium]